MSSALFTVTPATHRGWTVGVEGETDLQGFAVVGPDGVEVDWFFGDHVAHADALADRLNGLWSSEDEIVRCKTCGRVVSSGDPERYPYCRGCHYVGNASEDVRADQLLTFRRAFPDATVGIDHTGGGCFWLAIRWDGSDTYYALTDGEASLPTDGEGNPVRGGWGYVGRHWDTEDDWSSDDVAELHYSADAMDDPSQGLTDADAVAIIRADIAARVRA